MSDLQKAAEAFADAREPRYVNDPIFGVGHVHHSGWCKLEEGFIAGAAWQREQDVLIAADCLEGYCGLVQDNEADPYHKGAHDLGHQIVDGIRAQGSKQENAGPVVGRK